MVSSLEGLAAARKTTTTKRKQEIASWLGHRLCTREASDKMLECGGEKRTFEAEDCWVVAWVQSGSTAGRIPGAVNSGNLLGRRVGDGRDAWGGDEHAAEKSEERRIGRPGGLLESVLCLLSKVTKPTACFCPIGGRRGE